MVFLHIRNFFFLIGPHADPPPHSGRRVRLGTAAVVVQICKGGGGVLMMMWWWCPDDDVVVVS